MSTMWGADPDRLDELSRELDGFAERLAAIQQAVGARVTVAPWSGQKAEQFREQWNSTHTGVLRAAGQRLAQAAESLTLNADQQRQAGAAAGGALAGDPLATAPGAAPTGSGTGGEDGGGDGRGPGRGASLADLSALGVGLKGVAQNAWSDRKFLKLKAGDTAEDVARTLWNTSLWREPPAWLQKAIVRSGADGKTLARLEKYGTAFGRIGPPLTLLSAVDDVVTGGGDPGRHGDLTRAVAVVGVIGSGIEVGVMATGTTAVLAAAAPEVLVAAGVGVAVYGAYSAGDYLYNHREAIGRVLNSAGRVGDQAAGTVAEETVQVASNAVRSTKTAVSVITHPSSVIKDLHVF